ncbi:hypothetical protein CL1_0685 [Thermococcus cleftensis]|uniref:DUF2240 family protein n=1 Tax=Thermococcus cleftensis (strain DSM 27260 / KACC 17922 / CL1) TaxID=163003 RepID=I3ZT56_THECF|nr:DUF2240 family protein [Thermococcus cleftensis]AFL94890.1 hypothetical protein CL1_0685 [Thermococcus cleftensis]
MNPLKRAVEYKGSAEFSRAELVGILAFSLRLMDVKAAKKLIAEGIEGGVIEERNGKLIVRTELLEESEQPQNMLGEMVVHIARTLGWTEIEVMEGIKAMRERYGDLDERILAYLFGMEKGVDMSRFKDRLEL